MDTKTKGIFLVFGRGLSTTLGYFLTVFGTLGFIIEITANKIDAVGIALAVFYVIGGLSLIIKSKKRKKEIEKFNQYISIIIDGKVRRLDVIAAKTGKSYTVVYKDLMKMIAQKRIENAYIDDTLQEIVFSNTNTEQPKTVICPSCGANNAFVGKVGKCEYCGSTLN